MGSPPGAKASSRKLATKPRHWVSPFFRTMGSMAPPYSSSRAAERDSISGCSRVPRRSTGKSRALAAARSRSRGTSMVRLR